MIFRLNYDKKMIVQIFIDQLLTIFVTTVTLRLRYRNVHIITTLLTLRAGSGRVKTDIYNGEHRALRQF